MDMMHHRITKFSHAFFHLVHRHFISVHVSHSQIFSSQEDNDQAFPVTR